jgi:hypothetical protein
MRWDSLFEDLEAQLDAADAAELDAEVRERSRLEAAKLLLTERLLAAVGHPVSIQTRGAGVIRGALVQVLPEWLLVVDGASDVLVPLSAVLVVSGLGAATAPPDEGTVARRLTLGYALRGLARSRVGVAVVLADGGVVHGTIDRVGADFLEISEHPPGEARRSGLVRAVRTVPFAAVGAVRST